MAQLEPDFAVCVGTYGGTVRAFRVSHRRVGAEDDDDDEAPTPVAWLETSESLSVKTVDSNNTGMMAFGGGGEMIHLIDFKSQQKLGEVVAHSGAVTAVQFVPGDVGRLVSASKDGTIKVWNAATWDCEGTLRGHKKGVNSLSLHPSGRVVLSVGEDNVLRVHDLASMKSVLAKKMPKPGSRVLWNPSGSSFAVVREEKLLMYDSSGEVFRIVVHDSPILSVVFLTDDLVATGADDATVRVWETNTGKLRFSLEAHASRIRGLDVARSASSRDGTSLPLLASADTDGFIFIWDLNSAEPEEPLHALEAGDRVLCMHVAYFGDDEDDNDDEDERDGGASSSATEMDASGASDSALEDDLADASLSNLSKVGVDSSHIRTQSSSSSSSKTPKPTQNDADTPSTSSSSSSSKKKSTPSSAGAASASKPKKSKRPAIVERSHGDSSPANVDRTNSSKKKKKKKRSRKKRKNKASS